jgi:hypothetical protein
MVTASFWSNTATAQLPLDRRHIMAATAPDVQHSSRSGAGAGAPAGVAAPATHAREWRALLAALPVSKRALSELVMEHLVVDGHPQAAAAFTAEAGVACTYAAPTPPLKEKRPRGHHLYARPRGTLSPLARPPACPSLSGAAAGIDLASIERRVAIRSAVASRRVHDALELLREHYPTLLAEQPLLCARLAQQLVLDTIVAGDWHGALLAARATLLPLCLPHASTTSGPPPPPSTAPDPGAAAQLLEVAEATMGCFAHAAPWDAAACSATAPLFAQAHRLAVAEQVNAAVLAADGHSGDSRLPLLLRMLSDATSDSAAASSGSGSKVHDVARGLAQLLPRADALATAGLPLAHAHAQAHAQSHVNNGGASSAPLAARVAAGGASRGVPSDGGPGGGAGARGIDAATGVH